jgi:hypothetical protein
MDKMTLNDAMKPTRIKAGAYRVAGNLILVKTPGSCLRGTGHNRAGNATKKCVTWKLYKTCLNNEEVLESLGVTNRDLFGAKMIEEFESKAEALRAVASAIQRYA